MKKGTKIGMVVGVLLVVIVGVSCGFYFYQSNKVATVITMDINPSIAISLNQRNVVLKVEGLNDDAKDLLSNNEFKGKSLEKAVSDISDSAIEKGYLDTSKTNHILINVEGKNIEKSVVALVDKKLKDKKVECNVIHQEISEESSVNAEKYGITESKASYIEDLIEQHKDINITFEELKDKTINEINEFITEKVGDNKQDETDKVPSTPTPTSTPKPSSTPGPNAGTDNNLARVCSKAKFVLENDDATDKVLGYLGLTKDRIWYNYQTVAYAYNGICCYETKIIHNKKMYKYYINVDDGTLVHQESSSFLTGSYEDVKEIVENYFITNYGAKKEDVLLLSAGGTLNETYKEATAKYNDVIYDFVIVQKTGVIKSVKQQ